MKQLPDGHICCEASLWGHFLFSMDVPSMRAQTEGMVHALQQTQKNLRPNGLLINVLDLPTPQVIEVHSSETVNKVDWLLDGHDF